MERQLKLINDLGLHARPASIFASAASSFKSKISVEKSGKSVNAKSIVAILSLGIFKGDYIKIIARGVDELEALNTLEGLINDKFGEY
jgi:phosphocarrier protein HPr